MAYERKILKKIKLGSTDIKKVYLGSTEIRPGGWQPGANTVAYYPLTNTTTINDMSGNGNHLTQVGNITYSTTGASTAASQSNYLYNNSIQNIPTGNSVRTYAFWSYLQNTGCPIVLGSQAEGKAFMLSVRTSTVRHLSTRVNDSNRFNRPSNGWKCHVMTFNGSTWTWYVDNSQIYSGNMGTNTTGECGIFNNTGNPWSADAAHQVGHFIIASRVRTSKEISDYYDATKGIYGIS